MEIAASIKGLRCRYRGRDKPALDGGTLCVSLNGLIPRPFAGKSWEGGTCTS